MVVLNYRFGLNSKCNQEMVELVPLEKQEDLDYVESLLKEFEEKTSSLIAADLLKAWPKPAKDFIKVQYFILLLIIYIFSLLFFYLMVICNRYSRTSIRELWPSLPKKQTRRRWKVMSQL